MSRPVRFTGSEFLSAGVGVGVGVLTWLAIVPWDLSTVDENDDLIANYDVKEQRVYACLGVVILVAFAVALALPKAATGFAIGLTMTFAALYSWRTSGARVVGANFWAAGLVLFIIPLFAATVAGVWTLSSWRLRRLGTAAKR